MANTRASGARNVHEESSHNRHETIVNFDETKIEDASSRDLSKSLYLITFHIQSTKDVDNNSTYSSASQNFRTVIQTPQHRPYASVRNIVVICSAARSDTCPTRPSITAGTILH